LELGEKERGGKLAILSRSPEEKEGMERKGTRALCSCPALTPEQVNKREGTTNEGRGFGGWNRTEKKRKEKHHHLSLPSVHPQSGRRKGRRAVLWRRIDTAGFGTKKGAKGKKWKNRRRSFVIALWGGGGNGMNVPFD